MKMYTDLVTHMFMNHESPGEPSDAQLDRLDAEYHLIKRKVSKLSATKRQETVKTWNKYKVRMGY